MNNSRRDFLRQGSALAGGSLLFSAFGGGTGNIGGGPGNIGGNGGKVSAADRITLGAIGLNGMGWADLTSALKVPGVEVVALCDIDRNVLDRRMKELADNKVDTSRMPTTAGSWNRKT
jgi:hypothetical protein